MLIYIIDGPSSSCLITIMCNHSCFCLFCSDRSSNYSRHTLNWVRTEGVLFFGIYRWYRRYSGLWCLLLRLKCNSRIFEEISEGNQTPNTSAKRGGYTPPPWIQHIIVRMITLQFCFASELHMEEIYVDFPWILKIQ